MSRYWCYSGAHLYKPSKYRAVFWSQTLDRSPSPVSPAIVMLRRVASLRRDKHSAFCSHPILSEHRHFELLPADEKIENRGWFLSPLSELLPRLPPAGSFKSICWTSFGWFWCGWKGFFGNAVPKPRDQFHLIITERQNFCTVHSSPFVSHFSFLLVRVTGYEFFAQTHFTF